MKKTTILIAALAGALLGGNAQAQQPGQGYFGIGFGAVFSDGASPYTDTIDDDTVGGFKIYGGRIWDNHFGVELGYYDLGKYDVKFGNAKIAESKASAVALSGVLATPLGGGYSFHVKAGLAFTDFTIDCVSLCGTGTPPLVNSWKRGVSGLLGLGMGAQLTQDLAMRIDYEHFGAVHHQVSNTGYKSPYDMLSVSVQFSF